MGKRVGPLSVLGVAIVCCLWLVVSVEPAAAATGVNQEISFEGKIVTASGVNIADGTYNMEFKIYTAAGSCNPSTGVGCTLGWTEDWLVSASNGVTFTSGTFQVNLDHVAANNFSGIDFNTNPLYLSMQVGSTSSCTPAGNFTANCGGDGEMKPYIKFTSTPYALNSNLLDGLDSTAFGQLAVNQTWTGTNLFQPTTNITGLTVKQTSLASPTADIFNVLSTNGSNIIHVTGPSANAAAVSIASLGANALTLTSGAALTFTGAAASTWDIGNNTLSLQTTNNGAITTGGGLLTVGGDISMSGSTPSFTSTSTLVVESASGSAFTASAQGTGQSNFGTAGSGTTVLGNTTGSTQLTGPLYTSSTAGVLVGDGTVTATPRLFQLGNSSLQGAETSANCSPTINAGAIYYSASTASNNTTTNEVRGCIDGTWTDIVTGDQLGILLFGVEETSGTSIGDITGVSGYGNAPCKVVWASTTSVTVAPCTAYSGGRKVVITSTVTISGLGTSGSVRYQHICLTGTNGAPQATASSTTETANVPAWNAAAPILCLATVKLSTTPAITNIYDTRVFTTSIKEYAAASVAVAPGWIVVINTAGDNIVTTITTAGSGKVRGVVAVGNTAGSTTTANSILVVGGPAFVKGTGTVTVGAAAQTSTTAGYARSSTALAGYADLGQIIGNGNTAACNATTNCQFSLFVDVSPH